MILLGEMRDLETISTALTAAETGHLVFATLHTQSAPGTIDRVIDVFPAGQQDQVRMQLAATLEGIVTQALLPTADGPAASPALEILLPDDAVRNLIRQAKVEQIYSVMQTGTAAGMQTMEQSLAELVLRGVVTTEARSPLEPGRAADRPARAGRPPSVGTAEEPAPACGSRRPRHGRLKKEIKLADLLPKQRPKTAAAAEAEPEARRGRAEPKPQRRSRSSLSRRSSRSERKPKAKPALERAKPSRRSAPRSTKRGAARQAAGRSAPSGSSG